MSFTHTNKKNATYYLNGKIAANGKSTLYFFTKDKRDTAIDLPEGYEVGENDRTGLPYLKKKTV
jgi:hypothetical protein